MIQTNEFRKFFLIFTGLLFCFGIAASECFAQDDESKGVTSGAYTEKRPATAKRRGVTSEGYRKSNGTVKVYRTVKTPKKVSEVAGNKPKTNPVKRTKARGKTAEPLIVMEKAALGLTVWLRKREKNETKELVESIENSGGDGFGKEWQRIESETLLKPGDEVKISFESSFHKGYLYIIDREEYTDGTLGEPKLIYPTLKSNGNEVVPGKLIFIPSSENAVLKIKTLQKGKQLAGDRLTVIVSPKALIDDSQLGTTPIILSPIQLAEWEKKWLSDPTIRELNDGAGESMTEAEEEASKGLEEVLLSRDDASPQTVYETIVRRGDPILITVPLKYKVN